MHIDAHQHFWNFDKKEYGWVEEQMPTIAHSFLPADLLPLLQKNNIDACVAVQARQTEEETLFLIELAKKYNFIKGVVGWIDLQNPDIYERLEYFSQFKILKGFRHILQSETAIDFMLQPNFLRGMAALHKYGFVYDILIFPRHLKNACKLVALFPDQTFVLDHIAKPDIKNRTTLNWQKDMQALATFPNVYCKISGMVTEGDWTKTDPAIFADYIQHVVEIFGTDRLLFGSDWPVCMVAASYDQVVEIITKNTASFSAEQNDLLWGGNCKRVYKIED
jgi:L-fuconolactonase